MESLENMLSILQPMKSPFLAPPPFINPNGVGLNSINPNELADATFNKLTIIFI